MLRHFLLVLAAALLLAFPLFSEDSYLVTESQMTELEEIFATQKTKLLEQEELVKEQQKSIQNLEKHLSEAQKSLAKYESKNFRDKLFTSCVAFVFGSCATIIIQKAF